MRRRRNTVWVLAILTVLLASGTLLVSAAAQKSSVPRVQDLLAMGEVHVKQLLPLMNTSKEGMVSKQEFLKFMEVEFDRLDKGKKQIESEGADAIGSECQPVRREIASNSRRTDSSGAKAQDLRDSLQHG